MQTITKQQHQPQEPVQRLYISRMPMSWTRQDLFSHFLPFGQIVEVILIKKKTYKFAFVEYKTVHEACKAKAHLHNMEIDGSRLYVQFAQPKQSSENKSQVSESEEKVSEESLPEIESNEMTEFVHPREIYNSMNHQFMINGIPAQIPLSPSIRSGMKFNYQGVGSVINGVKSNVTVTIEIENDKEFEIQGDDIIHHVYYPVQYQTYCGQLPIRLLDGNEYPVQIAIYDGYQTGFAGFGLLKPDGSRGNYYLRIHLN